MSRLGGVDHANRSRPFVVEFIGTPGAGKTTLALRLVSLLKQHGVRAATFIGAARTYTQRTHLGRVVTHVPGKRLKSFLLWWTFYGLATVHAVLFVLDHPALTRHVIVTQARRPLTLARKIHIIYWFFQLCGRYRFLSTTGYRDEVLVIDDGFLHRAVSLHASHIEQPDPTAVSAYVELVPRPDVIVFTIAHLDVCEQRVLARGVWKHSRRLRASDVSKYLANGEWGADVAVTRARQLDWPVVGVENGGRALDRVEADLSRVIAHCLAASPTDGAVPGGRL